MGWMADAWRRMRALTRLGAPRTRTRRRDPLSSRSADREAPARRTAGRRGAPPGAPQVRRDRSGKGGHAAISSARCAFDDLLRDLKYAVRAIAALAGLHRDGPHHPRTGDWRDDGGVQRRLCGADQAAPLSARGDAREPRAHVGGPRRSGRPDPGVLGIALLHVPGQKPDAFKRWDCGPRGRSASRDRPTRKKSGPCT